MKAGMGFSVLAAAIVAGLSVSAAELQVEKLTDRLVRVREKDSAGSLLNRYKILEEFKPLSTETVDADEVEVAGWKVSVKKEGKGFRLSFPLEKDERVYGLGDANRDCLERRGGRYEIYVANVTSYIPIPMVMTSRGRGVLLNVTERNVFDIGKADPDAMIVSAEGVEADFYVFTGKDYREMLDVYTSLSGRPALLPAFAFGFAYVANQWVDMFGLVDEADRFRQADLPCDILGLEPGWMEYFYDSTTKKSWNTGRFSFPYWCKPKRHDLTWIGGLERMGFKLSLWLCMNYDLFVFEEACAEGRDSVQASVGRQSAEPGKVEDVFIDERIDGGVSGKGAAETVKLARIDDKVTALRRKPAYRPDGLTGQKEDGKAPWFKHLTKFVDRGARCFKLDGSEQVREFGDRIWAGKIDNAKAHNAYTMVYAKQMAEGYETYMGRRAMVYSAGGYAGVQRYVATWAGDTGGGVKPLVSVLNLAMSGHPNQSCDMSIFDSRSVHFGVFAPWCQQNNWDYFQQPWYQDAEGLAMFRDYIHLRYRLFPYLYGTAAVAARTGWPIMRPLAFAYPEVADYANEVGTYMLGDALLVSSFVDYVKIPEGTWYEWRTGKAEVGPKTVPVEVTPMWGGALYVKAGSIVPMWPKKQHIDRGWNDVVELHVWPGADGTAELYEDDGDSLAYRTGASSSIPLSLRDGKLTIGARKGSFKDMPAAHEITVVVHERGKTRTIALGTVSADRESTVAVADDETAKVVMAMRPKAKGVSVASLPVACTEKTTVTGEAPSLLPDGREFRLVWNDEFNGTQLDTSKWGYRTNFWGRRFAAFAGPEDGCVEVKDGKVHLRLKKRADGHFCSPQLQTGELLWDYPRQENGTGFWPLAKREKPKFVHRYGYYEARVRLQRHPGWWSAFWMQSETQGTCLDPARAGIEHDIMESFYPGDVGRHMFHMNGYGADYVGYSIPREANASGLGNLDLSTDEFHTFGLLWEPDGYTVFVDGRRHGEKTDPAKGEAVSQVPEFILISTECQWYRNNRMTGTAVAELEESARRGDDFVVDFVRVYDIVR